MDYTKPSWLGDYTIKALTDMRDRSDSSEVDYYSASLQVVMNADYADQVCEQLREVVKNRLKGKPTKEDYNVASAALQLMADIS